MFLKTSFDILWLILYFIKSTWADWRFFCNYYCFFYSACFIGLFSFLILNDNSIFDMSVCIFIGSRESSDASDFCPSSGPSSKSMSVWRDYVDSQLRFYGGGGRDCSNLLLRNNVYCLLKICFMLDAILSSSVATLFFLFSIIDIILSIF